MSTIRRRLEKAEAQAVRKTPSKVIVTISCGPTVPRPGVVVIDLGEPGPT